MYPPARGFSRLFLQKGAKYTILEKTQDGGRQMAYTDDWENLMNGVFGPGGKLRFDTQKTPPEKPGLPDMNAQL